MTLCGVVLLPEWESPLMEAFFLLMDGFGNEVLPAFLTPLRARSGFS